MSSATAAWLGAHPTSSLVVVALAAYGMFVLVRVHGVETWERVTRRPGYGEDEFMAPSVVWLLLTAAESGRLEWERPGDDECPVGRWTVLGASLPGYLALPDQPWELLRLGWLETCVDSVQVTDAGRSAVRLIETDERAYRRELHSAARRAPKAVSA